MSDDNDLILVDKYLTVVRRNLLIKDKDEIINDLHDEILDSLHGNYSESNIKKVLESLGNPTLLAIKYQSSDKYLIGPQIYDFYLYTTKICLQISSVIFLVISILSLTLSIYYNTFVISAFISKTIIGYINLAIQVFFWTTFSFAIYQKTLTNKQSKKSLEKLTTWDISKLDVVQPQRSIKKSNSIATIIITPIVFLLFVQFRHFNITINSYTYYILNQSILPQTFILYGISSLVNVAIQLLLLIEGKWTRILIVFDLFAQLLGIAISYYLIVKLNLFNFIQVPMIQPYSDTIYFWTTIGVIITAIITVLSSLYKLFQTTRA